MAKCLTCPLLPPLQTVQLLCGGRENILHSSGNDQLLFPHYTSWLLSLVRAHQLEEAPPLQKHFLGFTELHQLGMLTSAPRPRQTVAAEKTRQKNARRLPVTQAWLHPQAQKTVLISRPWKIHQLSSMMSPRFPSRQQLQDGMLELIRSKNKRTKCNYEKRCDRSRVCNFLPRNWMGTSQILMLFSKKTCHPLVSIMMCRRAPKV
mmetsp:Transcript_32997/g.67486  ORF Transcript_32997/g.67486 Transcript_32997/m.67486 type:complete len:205 (-) Transcript_32997:267-881(-)